MLNVLSKAPKNFEDIINFTLALETAINFNAFTPEELVRVINSLSPFESNPKNDWVSNHFKQDQLLLRGYQGYGFNFNGLYQELACLYAADGEVDKALRSIDTLLKYTEPYYQRDYTNMLDNAANVASVFYRTQHTDILDAFVKGYCERKKISEIDFYQRLLGRTQPYQLVRNSNYQNFWPEAHNLNLHYGEEREIAFFYENSRKAIKKSVNGDERNFLLALSCKNEGITIAHHSEVAGKNYDREKVTKLFDRSIEYYTSVGSKYLNENIERVGDSGADIISDSRSSLFLFPDLIYPFTVHGARDYHWNYMSASFIEYLVDQKLFDTFYQQPRELKLIENWLKEYHVHAFAGDIFMRHHAGVDVLVKLENALAKLNASTKVDVNLLYLYLGYYFQEKGNQPFALNYYSKLRTENFGNLFRNKILPGYSNSSSFKLIGKAFSCYTQSNMPEETKRILNFFKKPANRSSLYAFVAREFSEKQMNSDMVRSLLDSAIAEMGREENLNSDQPNRYRIAIGLITSAPTENSVQQAKSIVKNQALKFILLQRMARALAYKDQLFNATEIIPDNISEADQMEFLWNILRGYAERIPTAPEWREYQDTYAWFQKTDFLPYVDEIN